MQLKFIGKDDTPSNQAFPLSKDGPILIGRGLENDIIVAGPRVGRRQAVILTSRAGYVIYDFSSRNSTRVNGKRVVMHQLQPGDEIMIGEQVFVVEHSDTRRLKADNLRSSVDDARSSADSEQTVTGEQIPARLLTLEAGLIGRVFDLDGDQPLRLGRGAENAVLIASPRVSRQHAEIVADTTGYSIRDLSSHNGTFVNGQRITTQQLRSGDRIICGGQVFLFELVAVNASAPSADRIEQPAPAQPQGIRCPGACGRIYSFGTIICPRDGRILANGQTVLA